MSDQIVDPDEIEQWKSDLAEFNRLLHDQCYCDYGDITHRDYCPVTTNTMRDGKLA